MILKTLRFSRSCLMFALHIVASLFLLALVLFGVLMWQFSKGPIDMTFAADYVKDAFAVEGQPVTISFDQIVAEWSNLEGSPVINLSNFAIVEDGEEKLKVGQASLQLALLPLLIGQIAPETIILDGPVIRMVRDTDGTFQFLVTDEKARLQKKPPAGPRAGAPTVQELGNGLFLGGPMPDRGVIKAFSNLRAFNIRNAGLIAEDYMSGVTWMIPNISVYLVRSEDTIDLSVNYLQPGQDDLSAFNARVHKNKAKKILEYSSDLRNVDMTLFGRISSALDALKGQSMVLNGIVQGTMSNDWKVQTMIASVRSGAGSIRLGAKVDKAFAYKDLKINLAFDRATGKLAITDTNMELNGTTVSITGERTVGADGRKYIPLTLKVPELTLAQIVSLWPEEYRDSNAGVWLTRDLTGAVFRNLQVTANIPEDDPGNMSGKDIEASFDFENLKADYRAPLTPGTNAKGRGTIKNDVLDIRISSGKVADLNVNEGSVVITELTSDLPGEAIIDLALNGPVSTVFEYISLDPINLGETIGIDPKKAAGSGDYKVNVTFPTSPEVSVDDVKVKVDATLRDTRLPGIVRGLDLTGGPLDLKVDAGAFTISGKGLLDGAPIDLVYSEYIDPTNAPYASDIKAKLSASKKLRDTFGINLDEFVEGDIPAEIHYKEVKPGDVTVDVTLDMTPVKAFVEPFNYVKPIGAPGTATCVAILKNDQIQQIKDLNVVMGPDKASGGVINFGMVGKEWDVKSGSFSTLSLGKDNQISLKFSQPSYNHLSFNVTGSKLDGRSFLEPDKPEDKAAVDDSPSSVSVTAQVATMRTGDAPDQVIKSPQIKAEINPAGDVTSLDLSANIGASPFSLTLKPGEAGLMKLKMTSNDAGATLHAFDIYDNMRGGQLIVEGTQVKGGGVNDIRGAATVKDFRIVNAPVLARLMNGLSLGGLDELMRGQGIAFTRLRTKFFWKATPQGRVINLTDGRTSGASIGLSFGGIVNQTKGTLDISGTFVPMSGVNKFVSSIPLVGQLLTGGKNGGIIAATYAIKGKSEDPSVFVNPLSVLAPGFLRSILFEGGFGDDDEDFDEPATPAKKQSRSEYN